MPASSRNALPESEKFKVNALFVQFYGGERAWSLGEAYAPEALQAEEDDSGCLIEKCFCELPVSTRP